jgi:hypothetical protein
MTDLFSAPPDDLPIVDPTKDYFEELVGEGKKFKTPADLARAKAESDNFIERLKQETEGLRQELNTRLTMEEYLEKMTGTSAANQSQSPDPSATTPAGNGNGNGLTESDLEALIEKKVSARDAERIQTSNVATVQEELRRHFGNDYVAKLRETTQALGLDESFMSNLAKTQPRAFLKLVGVQGGQQPQAQAQKPLDGLFAPPVTQQHSSFAPATPNRNMNYYEAIRKKDPKTYWSASMQNQLHQDAQKLGEDFYS